MIPIPQNAYLVANGTGTIYPTVFFTRSPTPFDLKGPNGQTYQPTQRWVNTANSIISGTFSAITAGNPTIITATNTFSIGQVVYIQGVGGITQLNGNYYVITAANGSSFTIDVDTTGSVFTSGGTATVQIPLEYILLGFVSRNGYIQANWALLAESGSGGGGSVVETFTVDAATFPGTNPVVPNGSNDVTVSGTNVAAHGIPIRTDSLAANSFNIEVQRASAIASTDATQIGLAAFSNNSFAVDSNGFVTLAGGGRAIESFIPDSGTTPVIPTTGGAVTMSGSGSITTVGGTNQLTTELTGLTNHSVLVGAGTTTITKVGPSSIVGAPLISEGSTTDPAFSTTFLVDDSVALAKEYVSIAPGGPQIACLNLSTTVGATSRIIIEANAQGVTSDAYILYSLGTSSNSSWEMGAQGTASVSNFVLQYSPSNINPYMDGTTFWKCDTAGNVISTGQTSAKGDGGGLASSNSLTGTSSTTISSGTGTVKMSSTNNADNAAWIKIYIGTTAYWIPAWLTNSP